VRFDFLCYRVLHRSSVLAVPIMTMHNETTESFWPVTQQLFVGRSLSLSVSGLADAERRARQPASGQALISCRCSSSRRQRVAVAVVIVDVVIDAATFFNPLSLPIAGRVPCTAPYTTIHLPALPPAGVLSQCLLHAIWLSDQRSWYTLSPARQTLRMKRAF